MFSIHDTLGTIGVLFTLIAFLLLNIHKVSADSYLYVMLNAIGSVLILESLVNSWNLAAFLMEIAWLSISLYALYSVYAQDKDTN